MAKKADRMRCYGCLTVQAVKAAKVKQGVAACTTCGLWNSIARPVTRKQLEKNMRGYLAKQNRMPAQALINKSAAAMSLDWRFPGESSVLEQMAYGPDPEMRAAAWTAIYDKSKGA